MYCNIIRIFENQHQCPNICISIGLQLASFTQTIIIILCFSVVVVNQCFTLNAIKMPSHVQNVNAIRSGKLKLKNCPMTKAETLNYDLFVNCMLFIYPNYFYKIAYWLFKIYSFLKHVIYKCILKNLFWINNKRFFLSFLFNNSNGDNNYDDDMFTCFFDV